MKAIVQDRYGSPDVLEVRDIPTPTIDDRGILVKVHAASVNALDYHVTRGMPYLIRMDGSFRKPSDVVRGVDLAGRVVAVGKSVTQFAPGDDVFGGCDGSFAEYAAATEERLTHKPPAVTY